MTSGAIHVAQVPESGWPCPLPPPPGCNFSTNRKRKPKWRRCVAASIAVSPSAIRTGSRTRPSDWGSNARFGPVEDRRKNRRLATLTCILWVLQIRFSRLGGCHLAPPRSGSPDLVAVTFRLYAVASLTASLISGLLAEAVPIGFISLRCSLRKLLCDSVGICMAFRSLSTWPLNSPNPFDAINSTHVYAL